MAHTQPTSIARVQSQIKVAYECMYTAGCSDAPTEVTDALCRWIGSLEKSLANRRGFYYEIENDGRPT